MDGNHTRGHGRRQLPALLMAMLWTSSALADDEALFFIDRERLVSIAIATSHQEYPDIEPGDLVFEKTLHLWCSVADKQVELSPAVAEALSPCISQLYLTRISTRTEIRYRAPGGRCMDARRQESIEVNVHMDGTAFVGPRGWQTGGGTANDCGEHLEQLPVCSDNPLLFPDSCVDDGG